MLLVVWLLDDVALPAFQFDVAVATVAVEAVVGRDDRARSIVAVIGLLVAIEFPQASVEVFVVGF